MLTIPDNILTRFEAVLSKRAVAPAQRADYKKWLRYFLDFCAKYPVPAARSDCMRLFIDKLREKKQTPAQQEQAAYAVSLYFEMQRRPDSENPSVHVNAETIVKAAPPSAPCINQGETHKTSNLPYLPAQLCHPPSSGQFMIYARSKHCLGTAM